MADRAALRRPLPARAPPRRRRHGDRPARVRHAAGALRRRQAAGRAPGRGRELRLALPPRGAGRRAARAPEHRAGLRLRLDDATGPPLHRHGVRRRALVRRAAARPRADAAARRRRDPHPGLPRARLRAPQRRRPPRRQARQPAASTTTAWSSSPTSASPRPPSSPTSRRSARCSAPRPTSRPSRRAASRPGPPSDLYALGVVSYQLLAGPPALRGRVADRPRAPAGGRPAAAARRTTRATSRRRSPPPSPRALARDPRAPLRGRGRDGGRAARRARRRRAGHRATGATRALPDDEATRMLAARGRPRAAARAGRCSRSTSRRAAPPPRRAAAGPPPRKRAAGPASGSRWCSCSPLAAGGVVRLPGDLSGSTAKTVELNEDVGGQVDEAVQSTSKTSSNRTRAR